MPFTPLHMGPGAAIKTILGGFFSLTMFGFAQVAMDIEPLVHMLRGDFILHGFTHTYLGATLLALAVLLIGRPCCQWFLKTWNAVTVDDKHLRWLRAPTGIPWPAAFSGAFIGTYSHVFLDSIMHADMRPWLPFSAANGWLNAMPVAWLHLLCFGLGGLGLMVMFVVFVWNKIANQY